ncbi:MAG: hypothetical protein ACLRQB_01825 [Christensenellales bacterium]
MAGEKFIALEETSQEIKASVENVNTSVNEIKVDVGDGAGTDLVSRVAQLQTKVDQLLNKGGGEFDFLNAEIQLSTETFSLEPNKEYAVYCSVNPGASTAPVITSDGRVTCDVKLNGKLLYHQSGAKITEPLPTNVPFKISVTSNSCFIQDTNQGDFIYIIK